jgi:hypothetical protein
MSRRGHWIALIASVVVLVGSMGLTAARLAARGLDRGPARGVGGTGWGPGTMDRGADDGDEINLAEAQRLASGWLAANQPGAVLGAGLRMPTGYVFPVTRAGARVGTLVVSDRTGEVFFRELRSPAPAASPAATA